MQESKNQHSWREFFKLIFKSKLPWHLYIAGFVAAILSTTLSLGLPLVMQQIMAGKIFDSEIVKKYILLSSIAISLAAVSAFFVSITGPVTKRNIQRTLWDKLIRMPMRQYKKQPSQQLISRVTQDTSFIDQVIDYFKMLVVSSYGMIGSFVIMYNMNVKLTLALLPVIPYILIVTAVVGHFTQKTQHGVQEQFAGITAFFAERLPRVRLIKSFGKEQKEIDDANYILREQYKAEKKRAYVDLFAEPLMQSVQAIIQGTVLLYGAYLVSKGEMKVSQVISFFMYVAFIHNSVLKYGLFWQMLKQAKGASEKISSILDTNSEEMKKQVSMEEVQKKAGGDLRLENVSFSYEDKNILSNINFTIPEGKFTAIVGPSGGGKSTILNLLERFYDPNVGRILMGNQPVDEIHLDEWRKSISYVSQSSPLLSGTIRDNITYGIDREVSDEEVRIAAEMADALEFIDEFPEGLDTEVGEFGSQLSGGQRQRIAIARAFIKDTRYLILDEATASLDARSENEVENSLKDIMVGRTTIMVAHDLNAVKHADQIIVIDSGKVNGIGNHEELFANNPLYRRLAEIQQEKDSRLAIL
ncbi:ABC transporter ATP-binding protein [Bacillus sp. FJAT-49732]|uniref:ABC transporter ATP-binding protein n=1 Tax=Lederbergia citrisecunda TaxID=2833583 RepID=A0A942TMG1_9BACI|nr:ABC transporter ATP-binding protein [Lederbergia citrisecunda]MBS4200981.1 ABC transporter ATP-binding protein [Lederbergia citrisecunda]